MRFVLRFRVSNTLRAVFLSGVFQSRGRVSETVPEACRTDLKWNATQHYESAPGTFIAVGIRVLFLELLELLELLERRSSVRKEKRHLERLHSYSIQMERGTTSFA